MIPLNDRRNFVLQYPQPRTPVLKPTFNLQDVINAPDPDSLEFSRAASEWPVEEIRKLGEADARKWLKTQR